jgi:hypothetical protein
METTTASTRAEELHAAERLFSRTEADAALVNAHCLVLKEATLLISLRRVHIVLAPGISMAQQGLLRNASGHHDYSIQPAAGGVL